MTTHLPWASVKQINYLNSLMVKIGAQPGDLWHVGDLTSREAHRHIEATLARLELPDRPNTDTRPIEERIADLYR